MLINIVKSLRNATVFIPTPSFYKNYIKKIHTSSLISTNPNINVDQITVKATVYLLHLKLPLQPQKNRHNTIHTVSPITT